VRAASTTPRIDSVAKRNAWTNATFTASVRFSVPANGSAAAPATARVPRATSQSLVSIQTAAANTVASSRHVETIDAKRKMFLPSK
jgi:hypothetical protein